MPDEGIVKLIRCPMDTECTDCKKTIDFGVWAYFNEENQQTICVECGVKRGWTPKQRIQQIIKHLEMKEDIKALQKQRKILADTILLLQEKVEVHRFGEKDAELETQIIKLMAIVEDYLHHCGTISEKDGLQKVFEVIRETQELQHEVRERIQNRMFMIEKKETKLEEKLSELPLRVENE